MWAEVNGERKKVACGPCIRGHRSSKCDHRDRVLVEVRKPGRPLSSCPHPTGSCSCERVVINYTIPKASECACPSERAPPTATVAGNSRITKSRRKSAAPTPYNLEKAIQAGFDTTTDTSSTAYTPSETSNSNGASLPSSASSTPRLLPAHNEPVSSCCKPKPILLPVQEGGCCGSKPKTATESPVQKKSCCSSRKQEDTPVNGHSHGYQHVGHQFQFPAQAVIPQYQNFSPQTPSAVSNPFGLGTPIYNHAAAAYHRQNSVAMSPVTNNSMSPSVASPQIGQHVPEHNCHCGELCSCFGCAAHPNNATMMEYVRIMAHFQYNGGFGGMPPPLYDMPTYPHQPGYGAEAGMSFNSMQSGLTTPTPTQMSFQQSMDMPNMVQVPMALPGNWPQQLTPVPSQPQTQFSSSLSYNPSIPAPSDTLRKSGDTMDSPAASSPSDAKDEDTVTLSPSSYFWNEMTLPSCSDASGTCQCGDGCACVGCLTHGGHTGEPLDDTTTTAAAAAEHDPFLNFDTDLALNMNDPTDFLSFSLS